MQWIKSKDKLPDNSRYVLGFSGPSKRPFVVWHDGLQWVGLSHYTPQVSFWCEIPELPIE